MRQAIRRRMKGERGFTLFELVIVLAIIGILVAVALPAYRGARFRAFVGEARQAANEWRNLVWACRTEKQNFDSNCNTFGLIGYTGTSSNWSYSMTTSGTATGASAIFSGVGFTTAGDVSGKTYTLTVNYTGGVTESAPTP